MSLDLLRVSVFVNTVLAKYLLFKYSNANQVYSALELGLHG